MTDNPTPDAGSEGAPDAPTPEVSTETVDPADSQAAVPIPVVTGQIHIGTPEDVTKTAANPTADPAALQFPSLVGASDTEIAERSPDQKASEGEYRKVYVVQPAMPDWEPPEDSDDWHRPNKAATLQEAINRGLHPSEETSYAGAERHADGFNWCLLYTVPVTPAAVDEAAGLAYVPQHSENVDHPTTAGIDPAAKTAQ